jgi:hypothetical protein
VLVAEDDEDEDDEHVVGSCKGALLTRPNPCSTKIFLHTADDLAPYNMIVNVVNVILVIVEWFCLDQLDVPVG